MIYRCRYCALAILLLVSVAEAQKEKFEEKVTGFRQVTSTFPVAIQKGTTAEVKLRSNFTLDGAYRVLFDKPGVSMTFLETEPKKAPRYGRFSAGTPFRFKVSVPDDQPTGIYEYRVATDRAVSSAAQLMVTEYPVVVEAEQEKDKPKTVQPVPIPSAVCGIIEKFEEVDRYQISGTAGQHVVMRAYAQQVTQALHNMAVLPPNTYMMNGLLTLYGPDGRMVAQNDNYVGGDPFIACTLPETGDYILEMRDARYAGNYRYTYCLEISDRPFAYAVFPMAVQRGTEVDAEVIGFELSGPERTQVVAAGDESLGWKAMRIDTPAGQTNPVPLCITEYPNIILPADSMSRETAARITLPVGVNGWFQQPDQTHCISFDAKKDAYYRFAVESHQQGFALDSVLEIWNEAGKKLDSEDDDRYTKDATLNFRAPQDGIYYVSVRDLEGRAGDRFLYHLRAEQTGPDFEIGGMYYYAMLSPGSHAVWFANIKRKNGFSGPVEMHVDGLPQGVSFTPVTIPEESDDCALILSAAADAPINASLARVFGKAMIPGPDGTPREIIRAGHVICEQQTSGGGLVPWPIHTQLVGVTKPADILKIEASPSEIILQPGGTAEINVRIVRREGMTEPVTLAMTHSGFSSKFGSQLPSGVKISTSSQVRLVGDAVEGTIVLEASSKAAAIEKFPLSVIARIGLTFALTANYGSNPITLTIPSPKVAQKQ